MNGKEVERSEVVQAIATGRAAGFGPGGHPRSATHQLPMGPLKTKNAPAQIRAKPIT